METKHGYQKLDFAYLLDEEETNHGYQNLDLVYLLDESGPRKGRSTADVTQVMVRIQEDTNDLKRRLAKEDGEIPVGEEPVATLLEY